MFIDCDPIHHFFFSRSYDLVTRDVTVEDESRFFPPHSYALLNLACQSFLHYISLFMEYLPKLDIKLVLETTSS